MLQGISPICESNLHFLHCRQILYHLSHQGRHFIHSSVYIVNPIVSIHPTDSFSPLGVPLAVSLSVSLCLHKLFLLTQIFMNITLLPPHPPSLSSSIMMMTLVTKEVGEDCDIWFIQKPCIFYISLILYNLNQQARREQDSGGVVGCGVHLSPWIHQEYTFRHRSTCRPPAEHGQEYLTRGKEYIESQKLSRTKELGGKMGVLVGLDLPSVGGETEAEVQRPQWGHCLSQRRNI